MKLPFSKKRELPLINIKLSNQTKFGEEVMLLTHIDSALLNDDYIMETVLQLNRYIKYTYNTNEIFNADGNEYLKEHCNHSAELLRCFYDGGYIKINEINKVQQCLQETKVVEPKGQENANINFYSDECHGCSLLKLDEPSICLTCKRAYNSEAEQSKTLRDLYTSN